MINMINSAVIGIKSINYQDAYKWCMENCKYEWDWAVVHNEFYFIFENKENAIHFKLIWGEKNNGTF